MLSLSYLEAPSPLPHHRWIMSICCLMKLFTYTLPQPFIAQFFESDFYKTRIHGHFSLLQGEQHCLTGRNQEMACLARSQLDANNKKTETRFNTSHTQLQTSDLGLPRNKACITLHSARDAKAPGFLHGS